MATPFSLSGSLADTLANRPAPSADKAGRFFLDIETGQLYRDTGAAWLPVRDALTDRPRTGPLVIQANDANALQVLAVIEGEPGELIEVFNIDTLTGTVSLPAIRTTSSVMVQNLNAHKVGGKEESAFAAASHSHSGQALLTIDGNLEVTTDAFLIYNRMGRNLTITEVFLSVKTAPVGADVIVDVHQNGASIFTTQGNRPTIAASNHTGYSTAIDTATWVSGGYLEVHVDQAGTSTPGNKLVAHIAYQ